MGVLQPYNHIIKVMVDDEQDSGLSVNRPFAHPLLADLLLIGSGKTNTTAHYKGTLQDVRINGRLVPIAPGNESSGQLQRLGEMAAMENLLVGTVSDDVCGELKPCGKKGECENTFNDYKCRCHAGWIGVRCDERDFCSRVGSTNKSGSVCPPSTECRNSHGGFVCESCF
jgi:hypothetical protein